MPAIPTQTSRGAPGSRPSDLARLVADGVGAPRSGRRGRLLPGLSGVDSWALKALGFGYGILSIVLLVVGALRQHRVAGR